VIATDYCLETFKNAKELNLGNAMLIEMLNSDWKRMEKYYATTDETPVHAASVI
jgi:hypothetical protein